MATIFANAGKAWVTGVVNSSTRSAAADQKYVAWGTGTGTSAASDTTLFTEASEARVAGTMTRTTTAVTNDTYQVVGQLVATGSKNITNAGVFDAATANSGNMLIKGDFSSIPVSNTDAINFTMTLQFM